MRAPLTPTVTKLDHLLLLKDRLACLDQLAVR